MFGVYDTLIAGDEYYHPVHIYIKKDFKPNIVDFSMFSAIEIPVLEEQGFVHSDYNLVYIFV